jgi:hypothetical protein
MEREDDPNERKKRIEINILLMNMDKKRRTK